MFTSSGPAKPGDVSKGKTLPCLPSPRSCVPSVGLKGNPSQDEETRWLRDENTGYASSSSTVAVKPWKSWITRARTWISRGRNVHAKHWKPMTLRAPILGFFILFSVALIAILEILAHSAGLSWSVGGSGAVAYANVDDNVSISTSFAYLYFPTIIAVCYSLLWGWVDLDARRLEAWFQLSKESGASAEDSLLLQYPFDFVALVPIHAAYRKQWTVFFAGTAMMVVFWGITPLQSAIFGIGTAFRVRTAQMATNANLIAVNSQKDALNSNFLMTAYGISWLGQNVPPFTTPSHAVMPFAPAKAETSSLPSEIWITHAEAYSTNLTCTAAKSTYHGNFEYDFDNGRGCSVSQIGFFNQNSGSHLIVYIGYYNDPHVDWVLQNPNCSIEFSNTFLAVWADSVSLTQTGEYKNMTALFCETSYSIQNVSVQVNASDFSIIADDFGSTDSSSRGSRKLSEDIFNITNFEYIIGSGATQDIQITDYPNTVLVEQYPKLIDYNITWPTSNMVGYAVAAASVPPEDLGNPDILRSAFLKAHQLLFAVAFNKLLEPLPQTLVEGLRDGVLQDQPNAIIFVRVFSLVVEILLLLVALMAAIIWYISAHRPSQMVRDPASIGDVMSMVSECHALIDVFKDMGTISKAQMSYRLRFKRFRLKGIVNQQPQFMRLDVLFNEIDEDRNKLNSTQAKTPEPERYVTNFRPLALRTFTGILFLAVLATSIGGLVYLNMLITRTNGLEPPSSDLVVRQILENYVPTMLATVLEPIWMVLNRLLCILKPFDELRKSKARPSRSIDVKYTSLPPPLVFWRALKSHHFLLATVCIIVLLANILAVSLSGLLTEAVTIGTTTITSTYKVGSQFTGSPFTNLPPIVYSDHFYAALVNASSGTSLPPWIGTDMFYTPFNIGNNSRKNDTKFSATTRGFGVSVTCVPLTSSSAENRLNFTENGNSAQFSVLHIPENRTEITCIDYTLLSSQNPSLQTQFHQEVPGIGANALEIVASLSSREQPLSKIEEDGGCERLLVTGWGRLGPSDTQRSNSTAKATFEDRSMDLMFLVCKPSLQSALFNVTVDAGGRILTAVQQTSFETNLQPFFNNTTAVGFADPVQFVRNQTAFYYFQANNLMASVMGGQRDLQWHNTTLTGDWINYLLSIRMNSTSLVSPSTRLPSPSTIAPALESLYRQLFATLLGLNTHVFGPADPSESIIVTISIPQTRIFMSQLMFQVVLVILILNLLLAIAYYAYRPKRFLPMMPTTIASIAGLVVATRALKDYGWGNHETSEEDGIHENRLNKENKISSANREDLRYGYGRFMGTDGSLRIGIEREPWVMPLEQDVSRVRKRTWGWRFGKGVGDDVELRSWL